MNLFANIVHVTESKAKLFERLGEDRWRDDERTKEKNNDGLTTTLMLVLNNTQLAPIQ